MLARSARTLASRPMVAQRRMMSGHSPEAAYADMCQWVNISFGMFGVCGLITGWVTYLEMNHEHHGPPEDRAYKKIRTKPYPWKCSDCQLFDMASSDCMKECRAKNA